MGWRLAASSGSASKMALTRGCAPPGRPCVRGCWIIPNGSSRAHQPGNCQMGGSYPRRWRTCGRSWTATNSRRTCWFRKWTASPLGLRQSLPVHKMQTLPREIADPQNPSVPSLLTMATNPVTQWPAQAAANRFRALVQTILRMFGIDRAIAYTLIGRGWGVLSGPLTIVMIAQFLRPEEQGFYYTFGSVIALNIFFELGLTYVLLQFASHEKAHLEWTPAGTLAGSELSKTRLAALLKLALRWYVVAASLILLLVLPGGIVFFSRYSAASATIAWRVPWIWLATASALNLLASPLFARSK